MFVVQVPLPIFDPDGDPWSPDLYFLFEEYSQELFGYPALAPANDVESGEQDRWPYSILLTSIGQGPELISLARIAGRLFGGQTIVIHYLGESEGVSPLIV